VKEVRLGRALLLFAVLSAGAIAGNLTVACSGTDDVGAGGTCFLTTDCKEGLFCLRADGSDNGVCTGKGGLGGIQPVADGAIDSGVEPMSDATPEEEAAPESDSAPSSDAQSDAQKGSKDAQTSDHAAPPADGSAPDTSIADTGSSDTAPATDM
jgi:hypothetical protein